MIEESAVRDFILSVDMFAGSSTGALIALGLAAEIPLTVIKDLYIEAGPKIFSDRVFDQFRDIGNLLGSQYSNKELGRWLHEIFGSRTLGDLKRKVIVPPFELDNVRDLQPGEPRRWKAKIFHNLPNREADNDRLLRDVDFRVDSADRIPDIQEFAREKVNPGAGDQLDERELAAGCLDAVIEASAGRTSKKIRSKKAK